MAFGELSHERWEQFWIYILMSKIELMKQAKQQLHFAIRLEFALRFSAHDPNINYKTRLIHFYLFLCRCRNIGPTCCWDNVIVGHEDHHYHDSLICQKIVVLFSNITPDNNMIHVVSRGDERSLSVCRADCCWNLARELFVKRPTTHDEHLLVSSLPQSTN